MSDPAMNVPFGRPWITDEDRRAVMEVLDGPVLTHGPKCHEFEHTFSASCGGGESVTTSSCTSALHLAYMHLKTAPGDEVVVSALSHVATVNAIEITGAKPVFVDVDPVSGNMVPALLEQAITPRTKAVALVHNLGIPCPMDDIMAIAQAHDLPVVEDCATALGARWDGTHVGLIGMAGCFSFYPAKHITAAEGGMLLAKSPEVAESIRRIRGFHYDRGLAERSLPGIYDVNGFGMNFRMSELQAALGNSQMGRLPEILQRRADNFAYYRQRLGGLPGIRILDSGHAKSQSSHYTLSVVLEGKAGARRNEALLWLKDHGVGTSVHYPHPLPRLAYYREKYGYDASRFVNAATIADQSVNLPVGPHMDEASLDYVATQFTILLKELQQ